ncbi:MAG: hypothetical protein HY730_06110 [Candidatus Tectomicrobia bacterium]|uniref:YtkA-like domain-containing protein n=1 Tax=Tectimicrobiota bacterium TaxID=2528274 RepID=A0A933LR33_UNCTE|nr:hypothetical protein [Candidatus Tectomicrobia bacterium]
MKAVIIIIASLVISLIAVSVIIGQRSFEETVVERPYEEGLQWDKKQNEDKGENPDCLPDSGPCLKKLGHIEILFDVNPKPVKAMEELTISVILKGADEYNELTIDFSMPGMYMGKNTVLLRKNSENTYSGKGIIPRCPSGRGLWRATVHIHNKGPADFQFKLN